MALLWDALFYGKCFKFLINQAPRGNCPPSSKLLRKCRSGRDRCTYCALWKLLYLALSVFSLPSCSLNPRQWGGSEKTLQKWPLKTILRSSVFHGADFSLGLVNWLQDRRRRVWKWFCVKLPLSLLEMFWKPLDELSLLGPRSAVRLNFPACIYCRVLTRLRKGGYKMPHHGCPQGEAQYLLDPSSACPSLLLPRARNLPIPGGEGSQHFRLLRFLSWLRGSKEGKP